MCDLLGEITPMSVTARDVSDVPNKQDDAAMSGSSSDHLSDDEDDCEGTEVLQPQNNEE